ncbi:MAG: hypothetical protein MJ000_11705 [Bacteroidales bacterium]|nr:hypothetical protein [Bacteroidales bacterium]
MFKPSFPFSTPVQLLKPVWSTVSGVRKKSFPESGDVMFCSFKSYGGTEREVNGIFSVEDTGNLETWFRPDITSDCRVKLDNGAVYEIMNEPENIEMRNQFLKFKVRRIKGGA